jgi:hypothetical protein
MNKFIDNSKNGEHFNIIPLHLAIISVFHFTLSV